MVAANGRGERSRRPSGLTGSTPLGPGGAPTSQKPWAGAMMRGGAVHKGAVAAWSRPIGISLCGSRLASTVAGQRRRCAIGRGTAASTCPASPPGARTGSSSSGTAGAPGFWSKRDALVGQTTTSSHNLCAMCRPTILLLRMISRRGGAGTCLNLTTLPPLCCASSLRRTGRSRRCCPCAATLLVVDILTLLVPGRLHRMFCVDRPAEWLPYMYTTLKSKCYDGCGRGRTCTRFQHSCARKIVSFAGWPARLAWRAVSSGLVHALKHHGGSWEVWSLKDTAREVTEAYEQLSVRPGNLVSFCARCRSPKPPVLASWPMQGNFSRW